MDKTEKGSVTSTDDDTTSLKEVLTSLAESSSWHGIPKIAATRQLPVKCLWCVCLVGTMVAFGIQLHTLFVTFYDYPIQTKVSLDFNRLRLPAITVCNMNPIRKSKLDLAPSLKQILYPQKTAEKTSRVKRDLASESSLNGSASVTPPALSTSTTWSYHYYDDLWWDRMFEQETGYNWTDYSFITDLYTEFEYSMTMDYNLYQRHFESPRDSWVAALDNFKTNFRGIPEEKRIEMGHSFEDMIHGVTYYKRKQDLSDRAKYTRSTVDYGNCHTIDSPLFVAHRSGPDNGITVTLNLEVDESISNFASGDGVRVVLHEPGTLPMPREEGQTITPGYETNIGLRVVRLARLGQPHGNCTDGKEFRRIYGLKYTKAACLEICRVKLIYDTCNCIPYTTPDEMSLPVNTSICDPKNKEDEKCLVKVDLLMLDDLHSCSCISPCSEVVYQKTMSGRRWPNEEYLINVLMRSFCSKESGIRPSMAKACGQLENETFDNIRYQQSFLRLNVYYEDLNYETIIQEPFYEMVRFISDIGGTMGLFLGCSMLSFMELLQLLLELYLYVFHKRRRSK